MQEIPGNSKSNKSAFRILGVRVDSAQIPDVVKRMEDWITKDRTCHYIAFTGMHGVAEANKDLHFKDILNSASLVVADGMPLVWLGRLKGLAFRQRVCGSELMEAFCRDTGSRYRHFLYGGVPEVAQHLAQTLKEKFETNVVGTYTPPFRALTEEEEGEVAKRVHKASPDVLWVGLSTPKQERWMYEHHDRLAVPVMLGVGAAFDMNCGRLRRAPGWMRENGLEWLFRLMIEPRRLWKRYLLTIPTAIWSISLEIAHLRKFE